MGPLGRYISYVINIYFFEFILKTGEFCLSWSTKYILGPKAYNVYSLHVQQNVISSVHFQQIAILHIQFTLTSSEPTGQ